MHIFGLHAADLIHEASNAVATKQRVQDIKFNVHAHPTLSEVKKLDIIFSPRDVLNYEDQRRALASCIEHSCVITRSAI